VLKARIDRDDPLAFVLTDTAEIGYGMYIAAALEQLSLIQNSFLTNICDKLPDYYCNIRLDDLRNNQNMF